MKIKIVMLYDEKRTLLGDLSAPVAHAYALKHGYEFVCYRTLLDPDRNGSWNKILAVRSQLGTCDWVLWLDADVIMLRNDLKLEEVIQTFSWDKPLMISQDKYGICFGVFCIKNCAWSLSFLDMLWLLGRVKPDPLFDGHDSWEQTTLKCLIHYSSDLRDQIAMLPEWLVANQNSYFWPDAWMNHYWASGRDGDMMNRARDAMLGIIRNGWSVQNHKV